MVKFYLFNVVIVYIVGLSLSSWFHEPELNLLKSANVNNVDLKAANQTSHLGRTKKYMMDWTFLGKTCVVNYKDICEVADYEIHVKQGISGHIIKAMLIQKEESDLVSVHNLTGTFSSEGNILFQFKKIPTLHYNIVLEVTDLEVNAEYTIGNNCNCKHCNDTTLEINLGLMKQNIIHKIKSKKKIHLNYPHSPSVNGKYLYSKYLLFHSQISSRTIELYKDLYKNHYELVHPCSGLIMTHSENFKVNYDLTSINCYHVYLVDKFLKKIRYYTNKNEFLFSNYIFLSFKDDPNSSNMITLKENYTFALPLRYAKGLFEPRKIVKGIYAKINTHNMLTHVKYIYKNNRDNRMEYVQLFRILFQFFRAYNKISTGDMLQYTTGMNLICDNCATFSDSSFTASSSSSSKTLLDASISFTPPSLLRPYDMYAEELAVLLNSLAFEFNADVVGIDKKVVLMGEKEFVAKYSGKVHAYMQNNQLILRESSEICLILLENIAHELSSFVNNHLSTEHKEICHTMRLINSYSNIPTMRYTYELDCNISLFYGGHYVNNELVIKSIITNKTLFDDVSVELLYTYIFDYTVFIHIHIDQAVVTFLKKFIPSYANDKSVITFRVIGRKSDRTVETIDEELASISFSINCTKDCTNRHADAIVIKNNFDYISVKEICIKNSSLPDVCFPEYNYSYIFDTRLLRVHEIDINPYPEIVLTHEVHRTIVEGSYCVLKRYPNIIPQDSTPVAYRDILCKEYIQRCALVATNISLNEVSVPSTIRAVKDTLRVSFSTSFDEKHEEMLQISFSPTEQNSNKTKSYLLTHFSGSFFMNDESNRMLTRREKKEFSTPRANKVTADTDVLENIHLYQNGGMSSLYNSLAYNIALQEGENKYTLRQTPKTQKGGGESHALLLPPPFGQVVIDYNSMRSNVLMKFLDGHIYFYEGQEEEKKNKLSSHLTQQSSSLRFEDIPVHKYECLGAYAYLMNKFNILVNGELNCEAIQMIIEILLKGKLGKYFLHQRNKIYLHFTKRRGDDVYDVFDLVDLEIYELHEQRQFLKKYRLNVSIDENNLNLLHLHRNVIYPNKYFSNMYILLFKVAYLTNELDFYTFFYDLTGIVLIDANVIKSMNRLGMERKRGIQNIQALLWKEYKIDVQKHTTPFPELMNEIALLAAYLVELTSSYRLVFSPVERKAEENIVIITPPALADIHYFVYVDEFSYSDEGRFTMNSMMQKMSNINTLVIRKKILCCSNFVEEVENSFIYYILYRYLVLDGKTVEESNVKSIEKAKDIVQSMLGRSLNGSAERERAAKRMADLIMEKSGYVPKESQSKYMLDLKCINLDMVDHSNDIIQLFATEFDRRGAMVSININKDVLKEAVNMEEEIKSYTAYFVFRNLSIPFVGGKTHKKETLELKRILLLKGYERNVAGVTQFLIYVDQVNDNSLFMLEKLVFISEGGSKLVKEINVEYHTFFVHPRRMLSSKVLSDTSVSSNANTKLHSYQSYYNKNFACDHYNNGLQVCNNPEYDYEGFSPFFVSYLENNQRKDILFKNNVQVANLINNKANAVSKRFNIKLGGELMSVDVYDTVELILDEVATSIGGILNFREKYCSTLYLNNGQLHIPNDRNSLISSIFYENYYCLDRGSIFRSILENCNFGKEELMRLFGMIESNILPYELDANFAKSLTKKELYNLIYYFVSVPQQVHNIIKSRPFYFTISGMSKKEGEKEGTVKKVVISVEDDETIKVSKSILQSVNTDSLVAFNTLYYTELQRRLSQVSSSSSTAVALLHTTDDKVEARMRAYVSSGGSACGRYDGGDGSERADGDLLEFTNAGPLSLPDDVLTYNRPSFTYTKTKGEIYVKNKSETIFSFNNIFLFEGKNEAEEKYLSAILVLSHDKFASLHNVDYIDLIGNAMDSNAQLVLKCYPRKNYDSISFSYTFNLEKNTLYFVCQNVFVKNRKNGIYEFKKYFVKYNKVEQSEYHIYGNLPVQPIYQVRNVAVGEEYVVKREDVKVTIRRVKDNTEKNSSLVKYRIYVDGKVILHSDPYVTLKPEFTLYSYLLNLPVYTIDDYLSYTYSRRLKYEEFLSLPWCEGMFKKNFIVLRTELEKREGSNTHNVYLLTLVKSLGLTRVIIRDVYSNEFVVNVFDDEVVSVSGSEKEHAVGKAGAEAGPEAESEAGPEAESEAGPEAGAEAGPEAGAEAGPEAGAEAESEAESEAGAEAGPEAGPEAESEAGPEAESEAGPEAESEAGPEAGATNEGDEDWRIPLVVRPVFHENKTCGSFLFRIEEVGSPKESAKGCEYFFIVHTKCNIREGLLSLHVSEKGYTTDGEQKHLVSDRIFNMIYVKIIKQVKLQEGDYFVHIKKDENAQRSRGGIILPENSKEQVCVVRARADGTVDVTSHAVYIPKRNINFSFHMGKPKTEIEKKDQEKAKEGELIKAREEAELRAREEAELRAREEAELRAREEAELRAREEAELRAREEAELRAREEAELKARAEAELKARAEAELKARAEAELRAREEAELRARAEAELRARAEADRVLRQKEIERETAKSVEAEEEAQRAYAEQREKERSKAKGKEKAPRSELEKTYIRNVDCLVHVKRTDVRNDGVLKGESYEKEYTYITGDIHFGIYEIKIKNGRYTGVCKGGNCTLEEWFLMDIIDDNHIKDGTYSVNIQKNVYITEGAEGAISRPPNSDFKSVGSDEDKPFTCIAQNVMIRKSSSVNFKKMIGLDDVKNVQEGAYRVIVKNGQYKVFVHKNIPVTDTTVFKSCIGNAWEINENDSLSFQVQIINTKKMPPGKTFNLVGDKTKKLKVYYLLVSKLSNENKPIYGENQVVRFLGYEGLNNTKYIVDVHDDKYNAQRVTENGDFKPSDEDNIFFVELFTLLHKTPIKGLYFVQLSNEKIIDVQKTGTRDQINLLDASSYYVDTNKDIGENHFKVEIIGSDENDMGMVFVEEYILNGYYLKEGVYYVTRTNGKYEVDYDVADSDKVHTKVLEAIEKMSGRELKDGMYEIFVERIFSQREGANSAQSNVNSRADTNEEVEENTGGLNIESIGSEKDAHLAEKKEEIPEGNGQKMGKTTNVPSYFRSYIYQASDKYENKYQVKKVIDGNSLGISDGKYFILHLNDSYYVSAVVNGKASNKDIIKLVSDSWFCQRGYSCKYYVETFVYNTNKRGNGGRQPGQNYYNVSIRPLYIDEKKSHARDDSNNTVYANEYVKIVANEIPEGDMYIYVLDNKYSGKDVHDNLLDEKLVKHIILLTYKKPKNGTYFVHVQKDNENFPDNCSLDEKKKKAYHQGINKTITVNKKVPNTVQDNVKDVQVFKKNVHLEEKRNIKDGKYLLTVSSNNEYTFGGVTHDLNGAETVDLKNLLMSHISVGTYEVIVSTVMGELDMLDKTESFLSLYKKTCILIKSEEVQNEHVHHAQQKMPTSFSPSFQRVDDIGGLASVGRERVVTHYHNESPHIASSISHCSTSKEGNCNNVPRYRRRVVT
ncbi:oocyst capsule protein, putative [Plasmodium ovale]|uniref:Oocyst capsule protein, putative n=1 Tax=Plasmodium ovale TaxID=36330 RepID=A0A1C3KRR7_PLAOA|nr:oocyst capsule protein, putative [Plasmodium ovale]